MIKLTQDDIKFLKILADSDFSFNEMTDEFQNWTKSRLSVILRQYYKENTMGLDPDITLQLKTAGITEDDGKSVIAYARRIGINIS